MGDPLPGLPGWGAKSTAAVLRRYPHLEDIPKRGERWEIHVSGAKRLAGVLAERMEEALLFRDLATLRNDIDVGTVEGMRWAGPTATFLRTASPPRVVRGLPPAPKRRQPLLSIFAVAIIALSNTRSRR